MFSEKGAAGKGGVKEIPHILCCATGEGVRPFSEVEDTERRYPFSAFVHIFMYV